MNSFEYFKKLVTESYKENFVNFSEDMTSAILWFIQTDFTELEEYKINAELEKIALGMMTGSNNDFNIIKLVDYLKSEVLEG